MIDAEVVRRQKAAVQIRRLQPAAVAAMLDWTKDPCARCGKYPLRVDNKTRYCRTCSRGPMRSKLYSKKRYPKKRRM